MKATGKHFSCVGSFAASMGFILLQSCDVRLVTDNGVLMQHQPSYGLQGMPRENLNSFRDFLEHLLRSFEKMEANRIGITLDKYYANTHDDWWLYGRDAVDQNVVDRTVGILCDKALTDATRTDSVMTMFGPISATFSACPLYTVPIQVTAPNPHGDIKHELDLLSGRFRRDIISEVNRL
jgi:hypothetical protein